MEGIADRPSKSVQGYYGVLITSEGLDYSVVVNHTEIRDAQTDLYRSPED